MRFLLVAAAFSVAVARVSWRNSELLDQFDLQGSETIRLAVCARGCYVFASLPIDRSGCEDNIFINHIALPQVASLANPSTGEKGYVELSANDTTAIVNYNPNGRSCPLAIFAVSKYMGNNELAAPSLIDPRLKDHGEKSLLLTFFSYDPFTIDHLDMKEGSVANLYHTGYDAISPYDKAYCHPIHSGSKSNVALFPIRSPLLTILMNNDELFSYSAKMGIEEPVHVGSEGMETIVASPGHIGCRNGDVFRFAIPNPPVDVHFDSSRNYRTWVSLHANLVVSQDNSVMLTSEYDLIYGDTRYGRPISADFWALRGLNITWTGTYTWSTFAFSLKLVSEDRLSMAKIPHLSEIAKDLHPSAIAKDSSGIDMNLLSSAIAKKLLSSGIAKTPLSSAIATTKGE